MSDTTPSQPAAISSTVMRQALDAVHEEAVKLATELGALTDAVPDSISARVNLIIALARHKFDVRTEPEKVAGPGESPGRWSG